MNNLIRIGTRFKHEESENRYILASVGYNNSIFSIVLINLKTGGRWTEPVPCKFHLDYNNKHAISAEDFAKVASSGKFTPTKK